MCHRCPIYVLYVTTGKEITAKKSAAMAAAAAGHGLNAGIGMFVD